MYGRVRISPKVDLQNLERAGLWLVGHPPAPKGHPDTTGGARANQAGAGSDRSRHNPMARGETVFLSDCL